jgi:chemotaxis protein CheC
MTELSSQNMDSLNNMITASLERSGQAISELLDKQVLLSYTQVRLLDVNDFNQVFPVHGEDKIYTINQIFSGNLNGIGLIIFDTDSAAVVLRLAAEQSGLKQGEIQENILAEIGNIILSSFIGYLCNFLHLQVKFYVPNVEYQTVLRMLESIIIEQSRLQSLLTIEGVFHLQDEEIEGTLLVVIGFQSFEALAECFPSPPA